MSATLQEHFEYISDARRTARFRQAIAAAIADGDVVVDLGCGFGMLGLLCLRAGAARVWGIDRTEAIEIARQTAERAGLADRYRCLHEHTHRAVIPEPADAIICDHVGYFGIDYGIVAMVEDARRRLLRPGGAVIPRRITLQLAGIASPACRAKADGWAASALPGEFHWLREYAVNARHAHRFAASDLATACGDLLTVDLAADSPAVFQATVELPVTRAIALDGLGGWFDCELAPGVAMTNAPLAAEPIGRDQAFFPFTEPLAVEAGDTLRVTMSLRHDPLVIAWTAENARSGEKRAQSTWAGQILSQADRVPPQERIPRLGRAGLAAGVVASYVDGHRTAREIEDLVARDHPELWPSEAEIRSFVQGELARIAE